MKAKRFLKPKAYHKVMCEYTSVWNSHLSLVALIALLIFTIPMILITGCKYNVSEPLWDQPYKSPPVPKINQVNPSAAVGGVNSITIEGENLIIGTDTTWVYFNNTPAEILSSSAASIVVRRPNLYSDSCSIKIIPHNAIEEAIYKPYKITQVVNQYGGFLQNLSLSVIAVDKDENLYVVETTSKSIHKVTPDGTNTIIGKTTYSPFDGKIGPDGNLYLTEKNRGIDQIDLTTGLKSRWTLLPSGFVPKYCDFGDNKYFYCGGTKTDLIILPFDLSSDAVKSGFYDNDDIQAIRFYSGYIYVAANPITPIEPTKIWRNKVNADGSVGDRELVFDMNSIGDSSAVSGITFSSDGKMYIASYDAAYPLIVIDLSTGKPDIFYKGIIRPYSAGIYWGTGNYLYMINGNTTTSETWNVYRVDMGQNGAPYY